MPACITLRNFTQKGSRASRRPAGQGQVSAPAAGAELKAFHLVYARAGIECSWIVTRSDHVIEVYREPAPDPSSPHGWRHASVQRLTTGA